ncbi:MAG: DUF4258 domain-containing protein [Romboutsia timonensis]
MKRMFDEMNTEEKLVIKEIVNNIEANRYSYHCKERMREKGITEEDVNVALNNYTIVELNRVNEHDNRVVIRSNKTRNGWKVCVVLSANGDNKIVTVWKNRWNDRHSTLRRDVLIEEPIIEELEDILNRLKKVNN